MYFKQHDGNKTDEDVDCRSFNRENTKITKATSHTVANSYMLLYPLTNVCKFIKASHMLYVLAS